MKLDHVAFIVVGVFIMAAAVVGCWSQFWAAWCIGIAVIWWWVAFIYDILEKSERNQGAK